MTHNDDVPPKRSFWGWGYEDRFPDDEGRRNVGRMVGAMIGTAAESLELLPIPTIEQVEVPPTRLAIPAALDDVMDDGDEARIRHTRGSAFTDVVTGLRGDYAGAPDLVATPRTTADVADVLHWAGENDVAVVPYGGGTSVVEGVNTAPLADRPGVISLDLRTMNQLLDVDRTSMLARIQAGATGPLVESQLATHGLTLRHFPQSFEFSTLGGWIATRAGGHFATVYTHIDELTCAIEAITPSGRIATPRWPASGAGPEPIRLLLGSEGRLGVVTEAVMKVRPRPNRRASVTVSFDELKDAVAATRDIAQSGLFPANCRLLDRREAALFGVSQSGRDLLLLGFEAHDVDVRGRFEAACAIARQHQGDVGRPSFRDGDENRGPDAASSWRSAFIDAPYMQSVLVSLGAVVETFETSCTWSGFEDLHADVIGEVRKVMKDVCGGGALTMRFTHVYPDGPAPYFTMVAPGRPGEQIAQFRAVKEAMGEVLLRHGAPITHHHAVGRLHRPWHLRQTPELHTKMLRAAAAAVDPAGLLNPGVLF